jgi:hypothetical protein
MSKRWALSALEWVAWSALAAGLSAALTAVSGLSEVWVPVVVVALTAAKALVARRVGDPHTAAFTGGGAGDDATGVAAGSAEWPASPPGVDAQ